MDAYQHKEKPTLYAYRKGCRCAGCKRINTDHVLKYQRRKKAEKVAAAPKPPKLGPVEKSVLAKFVGLADIPWQETWMLLALQHARTLDMVAVTGQNHLAGTAHAKLAECLDRLRPPTPLAAQAVAQGVSDLEAFANDL